MSIKSLKRILALCSAFAMVLSLAACGGGSKDAAPSGGSPAESSTPAESAPSAPEAEPAAVRTLTVGTTNKCTVGFLFGQSDTNKSGTAICYDALFEPDAYNGGLFSRIVEEYHYDDPCTLVITLKDGITFSNGDTLDAEDVVWSYKGYIERGGTSTANYEVFDWDNVVISDDKLTFTVTTENEYAPALATLDLAIESIDAHEEHPDDDQFWWDNTVGSGPYYCVEQVDGAYAKYALRDDYWGPETYAFDEITIKYYGEETAMMIDYENGAIDAAFQLGSYSYEQLLSGSIPDTTVKQQADGNVPYLCFDETRVPAFGDERVRLAMAYAMNLDDIGLTGLDGLYKIEQSCLPESAMYYYEVGTYEYNVELAKELLAEAGYADGLSFELVVFPKYQSMAEAIQGQLMQVGIDVKVTSGDMSVVIPMLDGGEADASIMPCQTDNTGEPALGYNSFKSDSTAMVARITDEHYNELVSNSYSTDSDSRAQVLKELQEYVKEHALVIPMPEQTSVYCYNTNVITGDFETIRVGSPVLRIEG